MVPFVAFRSSILLCALGFAAVAASTIKYSGSDKFDWWKTKYVYPFRDSYTFVQGTEGLVDFR